MFPSSPGKKLLQSPSFNERPQWVWSASFRSLSYCVCLSLRRPKIHLQKNPKQPVNELVEVGAENRRWKLKHSWLLSRAEFQNVSAAWLGGTCIGWKEPVLDETNRMSESLIFFFFHLAFFFVQTRERWVTRKQSSLKFSFSRLWFRTVRLQQLKYVACLCCVQTWNTANWTVPTRNFVVYLYLWLIKPFWVENERQHFLASLLHFIFIYLLMYCHTFAVKLHLDFFALSLAN